VPVPDGAEPLIFNAISPLSPDFDADDATGGLQFGITSPSEEHSLRLDDAERWTSLSGAAFRPGNERGLLLWMAQRAAVLIDIAAGDGHPTDV